MNKIRKLSGLMKASPTLTCILCYGVLIAGVGPFLLLDMGLNYRDEYPVSLCIMILFACVFGLFTWLWLQSLQNNRRSCVSAICGIPYLLALLWLVNDADKVPVYISLLVVPALLSLMQKKKSLLFVCILALAILLFCCLNPNIRVKRYVHKLRGDCMCCGYQERDIHELILLGDKGCNALAACLAEETRNDRPSWCAWGGVCSYALKELRDSHKATPAVERTITDAMKDEWPNHTSEGIRQPADGSPKPSV